MKRIAIIAVESCMLFVLSFGVLVASGMLLTFADRAEPGAGPPWKLGLVLCCAVLGLLALWTGFVLSVLLRRPLKGAFVNVLLLGLFLGGVADAYFFVAGAWFGAGYLGFGFSGWLLLAVVYGGPLLMAAHVGTSAFKARRTGLSEESGAG